MRVVIEIPQISQPLLKGVAARARSYQFAQVLELMQQNEQKEQFLVNMQQQGIEQQPISIGNYRF